MADPTREQVELVVRLPTDLHEALKARAETDDRSMAAVIRIALRRYVAAHDQDHRVLWEGETRALRRTAEPDDESELRLNRLVPVPPGTRVRVVAVVARGSGNQTSGTEHE